MKLDNAARGVISWLTDHLMVTISLNDARGVVGHL
jgi:hypothetical protein